MIFAATEKGKTMSKEYIEREELLRRLKWASNEDEAIMTVRRMPAVCFETTPDRLRELAQADRDGRLVVLPCKVGDTVYINGTVRGTYSAKVRTFFCGHPAHRDETQDIRMIRTTECDIPMPEFGKTVFMTREEAEAALKGGEINA